jgi:hypothetical protein
MLSPLYGQLSPLRVPTKAVREVKDSDALAYIAAVEIADGQSLEAAVQYAYEDFILGCKADGIWTALKASCILAGARTLSGALVPLVGSAPTNFNFVSGDYNRKTGLKGATTKYLRSNRNNNADPQNSKHLCVYVTERASVSSFLIGGNTGNNGNSFISTHPTIGLRFAVNANSSGTNLGNPNPGNLIGGTRSNSTTMIGRAGGANVGNGIDTIALNSQTPASVVLNIFTRQGALDNFTNARVAYYSIGESLDLAFLDTRVSTLTTDLAAAIP